MAPSFELHRLSSAKLVPAMQKAFVEFLSRAHSGRPMALVGLPGGHSLDGFYNGLGKLVPSGQRRRLFFFPLDERVVGKDSRESNGRMLQAALCEHQLANPHQVLLPDAADLKAYGALLSALAPGGADLLIFGAGEDGHIASLFPKRKELEEKGEGWLEINDSPKPPPRRITISPAQIRKAKEVWLVFRGKEKQKALECFFDKKTGVRECPAKLVLAGKHAVRVWTDLK